MKTTYYVASTLDGFIAQADGGVDFLSLFGEPDAESYKTFFAGVDGLLMGRRTYDQILGFGCWPYDDRPCWVMTHRDLDASDNPTVAITGTPRDAVDQIIQRGTKHLWLVGGADLASQFLRAGLLDKIVVSVVPVLLGSGIPLFSGLTDSALLTCEGSVQRPNGIVEITYAPKNIV